MNGVFLVALCLSIFLEAIQRFVEPQSVSNPKLVLVVGILGLLSNILGLFLFHEHGHSHGGEPGRVVGENKLAAAEEGHGNAESSEVDASIRAFVDEGGSVADILPQSTIGAWPGFLDRTKKVKEGSLAARREGSNAFNKSDEDDSTAANSTSPVSKKASDSSGTWRHRHNSGSRSRIATIDDKNFHPAILRNDIISKGRLEDIDSATASETEDGDPVERDHEHAEGAPLLGELRHKRAKSPTECTIISDVPSTNKRHGSWHDGHNHTQPKKPGQGHSHSDLNMRGVFLHVIGDALGNIGVIASALIIWLTSYTWKFYADPAISLIITLIILWSAIPLCKAAAKILLQAVPAGMNVDKIKEDIKTLPGILSCHHLHVWQLSDTKLVASLHIKVDYGFKGEGSARYMQLARAVKDCLHEYGIHSSTIQPEFFLDSENRSTPGQPSDDEGRDSNTAGARRGRTRGTSKGGSKAESMRSEPEACLLECGDECDERGQCCAPGLSDTAEAHEEPGKPHD